jgi:hypothetical protein
VEAAGVGLERGVEILNKLLKIKDARNARNGAYAVSEYVRGTGDFGLFVSNLALQLIKLILDSSRQFF